MSSVFVASQSSCFFSLFARTNSPSGKPTLVAVYVSPCLTNPIISVSCLGPVEGFSTVYMSKYKSEDLDHGIIIYMIKYFVKHIDNSCLYINDLY